MKLSEQWIISQAPNAAATKNGRMLSQKGSFSQLQKTEDETLFWADCKGSGKQPYHTSIDLSKPDSPVCRCSCPSRQFPCKHAIGLMFEILGEKPFTVAEIPKDLAEKRAKQADKAAKKSASTTTEKPKRSNAAAKAKKIKKQLEGLDKAQNMMTELLSNGLGTLAGTSVKIYEALAKELGSYYLTGAQTAFIRLAEQVETIQQDPDHADYQEAIRILIWLNAMIQKSRDFLQKKLDQKEYDVEDNLLYEALGGIWKLEELEKIGLCKTNVQLIQLSFDVLYDFAKQEYIDRAYWMELDSGAIHQTLNYRPFKAVKYIKAEDSCFEAVQATTLCYYPGSGNQRIRWQESQMKPISNAMLEQAMAHAQRDVVQAVKLVKNEIKNTMSEKYLAVALAFARIGKVDDEWVAEDAQGARIVLRDRTADGKDHATVDKLNWLPSTECINNQVLFGLMFYDPKDARICMHPYSIVMKDQIVRLQY